MKRPIAFVLAAVLLVLGTGAVQYAHNHAHLEHAAAHAPPAALPAESQKHHDHDHDTDEANCLLHALMRGPMLSGGWVPLLVCLGLFVAFLTLLASQPTTQRFLARLDCRGPPARLLIPA